MKKINFRDGPTVRLHDELYEQIKLRARISIGALARQWMVTTVCELG